MVRSATTALGELKSASAAKAKNPGGKVLIAYFSQTGNIIHAQYNTPISMYSQDAIMDAIAGQAQAQGSDFSG